MKHHPYITRQLRTCAQCKVTYLPRAGAQRYCTTACQREHRNAIRRGTHPDESAADWLAVHRTREETPCAS